MDKKKTKIEYSVVDLLRENENVRRRLKIVQEKYTNSQMRNLQLRNRISMLENQLRIAGIIK